jgi:hypothetical protein
MLSCSSEIDTNINDDNHNKLDFIVLIYQRNKKKNSIIIIITIWLKNSFILIQL